jgi:hypothetical protein
MILAFDWVAASSIATAVATFVLALATFAAVRSGGRTARIAERSLLVSLRCWRRRAWTSTDPTPASYLFSSRWTISPFAFLSASCTRSRNASGVSGTLGGLLVGALPFLVALELLR